MDAEATPASSRDRQISIDFLRILPRFVFPYETLQSRKEESIMAWIRTIPLENADESLLKAMADQRMLYPPEYAQPVQELEQGLPGIVASHTLIPQALHHAFATFGALMAPDLPLERRQHEMIATMVSLTNKCHY
jgi:hypothetical protein